MKITEEIFHKQLDGYRDKIKFSEFKVNILPEDYIRIESCEAYYGSDSQMDAHTIISVYREREQTEEEKRISKEKLIKVLEKSKKERYELFLKLKKEFEK